MRAVVFEHFGDESVLKIGEVERPSLGADEVRIGVATTSVNRADLLQRSGHYPPPPGASPILGLECAGEVIETGANVTQWKKGDRVMALLPGGGYAEEAVVHAGSVMAVPDRLTIEEAGALPETFLTAHLNIFDVARGQRGEVVLIHGGSSGVGTAGTTLAKLAGLRVLVTAGTDARCAMCRDHGADLAINYRHDDFVDRARQSVDIVLDHIGARYLTRNLQTLRTGGRIVIIGSMGGDRYSQVDVASLLSHRQQIIGSTLRSRSLLEKETIVRSFLNRFGDELRDGKVRPVIYKVLPLEEAAEAHRIMRTGEHFGKIVLTVR